MSLFVMIMVLLGALLHAGWNAIVKGAGDKLLATVTVGGSAGLLSACALPFLAAPAPGSWPFIAASSVCQVGYYALIANAYRIADLSQTYPLMRGSAPLFVAVLSPWLLDERLSALGWVGVALIGGAILSMAFFNRLKSIKGVWLALLNALVIAAYTLIDGAGARRSDSPVAYTLWIFLFTALALVGWAMLSRRAAWLAYVRRNAHYGAIGGVGTVVSYAIALWAMTQAPVALVAGLREISILFAVLLGAVVLKERVGGRQWLAAAAIVAGTVMLRLA